MSHTDTVQNTEYVFQELSTNFVDLWNISGENLSGIANCLTRVDMQMFNLEWETERAIWENNDPESAKHWRTFQENIRKCGQYMDEASLLFRHHLMERIVRAMKCRIEELEKGSA